MALLPKVRLKAVVNFPATIRDGTGIDVTKTDGHYQLDLAYDDFAPPVSSIPDAANQTTLIWNSVTEAYTLVPVSEFGVGGAITEAPTDGQQYGRQSSSWTVIAPAGGTGDVVGPASAVNDRIAVFDGVTGKLIKDGGTTIAAITGGSGVSDGDKGDITVSGTGATWTIDADAVIFAKMQNASGASVLIGRGQGGGSGDFQEISLGSNISMAGTVLNVSTGTATLGDGDYGDIVVSSSGTILTIDADVVTYAKMQNIATDTLIGRDTAGTGDPEAITLGASLSMSGVQVLQRAALTGDVTASVNSNATVIANDVVTNAKLANMAANTIKGRITGSTGDPEDLSAANVSTILGLGTAALKNTGTSGNTVPLLDADNTWTGIQGYAEAALTAGSSVTWNVDTHPCATLVLTASGSTAISVTAASVTAGRVYTLRLTGSASTATWEAAVAPSTKGFDWAGGTAPTVTATGVDRFTFIGRANDILEEIGRSQAIA